MPNAEHTRANDRALVDRLLKGDQRAFDEFNDTMIPRLYRFALRRLDGNTDLARDIVQTTLCKVIAKLDTYRAEAAFFTWLCSCCRNEIAMHFRRAGSRPEEVELEDAGNELQGIGFAELESQEARLMQKESASLVHETLDHLPEHYADALTCKYLEGMSVKQIAWRLQLGDKAAESLLTRAREAFRKIYPNLSASAEGVAPPVVPALETARGSSCR